MRGHEPLDAEERALAQRLARLGAHAEPSASLDARILAAARAGDGGARSPAARPRRRVRWPAGVGIAASLAVAVGLAWQLRPQPDAQVLEVPAETGPVHGYEVAPAAAPAPVAAAPQAFGTAPAEAPAKAADPSARTPAEIERAATGHESRAAVPAAADESAAGAAGTAPAGPADVPPSAPAPQAEPPLPAAPAGSARMAPDIPAPPPPAPPAPPAPAPAPAAAAERTYTPPPPAAREDAAEPALDQIVVTGARVEQQRDAAAHADQRRQAVARPAAAAMPQARREAAQPPVAFGARTATGHGIDLLADQPLDAEPPASADSPQVRERWLQRIRELREAGALDEARASLREFTHRHPDVAIPDDLRALLDE